MGGVKKIELLSLSN